jgi:hypothetical protein
MALFRITAEARDENDGFELHEGDVTILADDAFEAIALYENIAAYPGRHVKIHVDLVHE